MIIRVKKTFSRHYHAGNLVLLVPLALFLIAITAKSADAVEEPSWRLQAYHLHRHADVATSAFPYAAPVLLSEHDLLTDRCFLDTVATALAPIKRAATPAPTQWVNVRLRDFTPVQTTVDLAASRVPPIRECNGWMPESAASVELRKRDAVPTQLHTVGLVDLGVFDAETVDVSKAAAAPLSDLESGDKAVAVAALANLGDEMERQFEVNIFLGDFTRTLCLSAAVYANLKDVGNLTAAIKVWVPPSVSPACAMRLSPHLRGLVGLSLTREDLLQRWPPPPKQRCHLREGHRLTFTFSPSRAQAKMPSFCVYEKADGVAASPGPGTRRRVRCKVYLAVLAHNWFHRNLTEMKVKATAVRAAAAVTGAPTRARVRTMSALASQPFFPRPEERLEAVVLHGSSNRSVATSVASTQELLSSGPVHTLASATSGIGGISQYKDLLRCTRATVGSGFWFSDSSECVEVVNERLSDQAGSQHRQLSLFRDCLLLLVVALGVAGFAGLLTSRVVKTVRSSRGRSAFLRW
ncbi:hypothetical protein ABL78_4436 [Leptomonas seymouri]|uniref:Uncharacterized protein n=1 Tax=Leptomonas seymouri TaxID=5684 RepID=A0A0N0P5I2_LEPSE|nr:hypothetical protein ABL78_4436 [Leptomonas seymouri]|eukprot:KPI86496.1 hypothetical protein ABL78_4436 [Leptomonas seymouri]